MAYSRQLDEIELEVSIMTQEGEGGCKSDTDCATGLSCSAGPAVLINFLV